MAMDCGAVTVRAVASTASTATLHGAAASTAVASAAPPPFPVASRWALHSLQPQLRAWLSFTTPGSAPASPPRPGRLPEGQRHEGAHQAAQLLHVLRRVG